MAQIHTLSYLEIDVLANSLATRIAEYAKAAGIKGAVAIYGVPRGGVAAAYALAPHLAHRMVEKAEDADVIVDDIIDSGATRKRYAERYPDIPFVALINKKYSKPYHDKWVVFPWEQHEDGRAETVQDNIVRLLEYIGEDPSREGLKDTPDRVVKAWREWASGYGKDAGEILKVFEDGAEHYNQMVTVKDIPFYSKCEHHLADIFGTVTIAYIPNGRIVGLSKLARLTDMYARRLQVQERMTRQIADALVQHLEPQGVGVLVKARHMCMESRGINQQGHLTITTALRGVLMDEPQTRAEFMQLAG